MSCQQLLTVVKNPFYRLLPPAASPAPTKKKKKILVILPTKNLIKVCNIKNNEDSTWFSDSESIPFKVNSLKFLSDPSETIYCLFKNLMCL